MKKEQRRGEQGFTLIEIIIVLVLLGILAATAVPKYFDLVDTANSRAVDAAVAEVQAQTNLTFSKALLEGDNCGAAVTKVNDYVANPITSGNFVVTVGEGGVVTVTKDGSAVTQKVGNPWKIQFPTCN